MPTPYYAVNCSIMMRDREVTERLDAVRAAGYEAVEFWWPFPTATPADTEIDAFIDGIRTAGVHLVGLNLFAGDMPAGERGVISQPGREDELRASIRIAAHIGSALNCRAFNALYGNRLSDVTPREQDELAVRNLGFAAAELSGIGTVLVEPVSGADDYPLRTADDVATVLDRVESETGSGNAGMLLDMYHLAVNGDDVPAAIERHRSRIAHVQVADAPGRGAPGTGELPLAAWVDDLVSGGYRGWIALEYVGSEPVSP